MTPTEYMRQLISLDPVLDEFFRRVSKDMQPSIKGFSGLPLEIASAALLYPVAHFIITQIGLPWLYELRVYSDLWRTKFHAWVERQYADNRIDAREAEATGELLRKELEKACSDSREAFERLCALLAVSAQSNQRAHLSDEDDRLMTS